jgi:hypothetical protein
VFIFHVSDRHVFFFSFCNVLVASDVSTNMLCVQTLPRIGCKPKFLSPSSRILLKFEMRAVYTDVFPLGRALICVFSSPPSSD